jgi:thioredoxin
MPIQFVTSSEDFDAYVENNAYLVVNFTAKWCGPCQTINPMVDQLYDDVNGKYANVEIVRVDLDDHKDIAAKYEITSIPTFVFLKEGQESDRIKGANISQLVHGFESFNAQAKVSGGRKGNGKLTSAKPSESLQEIEKFIPKGYSVLNNAIDFSSFEVLNSMEIEGSIKQTFDLSAKSTIASSADSQILFYVPLLNLSKIYSILIKFKKELPDFEDKDETQLPNIMKVWPNNHHIMSFDDATNDNNPAHLEKIAETDEPWYECKMRFVRFQNVHSLNILFDGDDEDYHTVIEKIVLIGINGDSVDQGTVKKLDDE